MRRVKNVILCTIITILFSISNVFAAEIDGVSIKEADYSKEYEKYSELSEDEKEEVLVPRKYELQSENEKITDSVNNPLLLTKMMKSANASKYSLRDVFGDALQAKNQGFTNSCWAFTTLGSLETNLMLHDYRSSNQINQYDFSERHMVYSSVRNAFLDNKVNNKGFNRDISFGGNFYMAQAYLTNGSGPIYENEMPFEDNENNIDISQIENKNVVATLYDTKEFDSNQDKNTLISEVKTFVSTYGGVYTCIYGVNLLNSSYYNPATSAAFVNDSSKLVDHAVLIVGWDDDFSRDNFNSQNKPQNNGAWIIRNSWGTEYGDNGYMYISYEDVNVYSYLWGVKKAKNSKDYYNIYQNDLLGYSQVIEAGTSTAWIANAFSRDDRNLEVINRISLYNVQDWKNCKVYINPNGSDKSLESLQEVRLKDADASNCVNIEIGYHTIEFAEPIVLNSDKFVVAVKGETDSFFIDIPLESKINNGWEEVEVNPGESFVKVDAEENSWYDTANQLPNDLSGNVTIKAFSEKIISESALNSIQITKQPSKIKYKEGENFDRSGMEVIAILDDGTRYVIDDYTVEDGENLQKGQEFVIISYEKDGVKRSQYQPISVSTNEKIPVSSNFDNAHVEVISTGNDNSKISLKLKGIKLGDSENHYKYSYSLLSGLSTTLERDDYWTEISNNNVYIENDGTVTLVIDIDINKLPNASSIANLENLYLHIREKAEIDGKETYSSHSFSYLLNSKNNDAPASNVEKVDTNNNNSNSENNSTSTTTTSTSANSVDSTVSKTILPRTGKFNIIVITVVIIGIGAYSYIRYRNIDK